MVQHPIQPAKAVLLILNCLPCYGPQGGSPVLVRRSYGTGVLCRLRFRVGSFVRVGPDLSGLPRTTTGRSDSLRARRWLFLSLSFPTGLVLAVRTSGSRRASQVSANSLLTCHAVSRRQTRQSLTFNGSFGFGCGTEAIRPVCVINLCIGAELLERGATPACG